MRIPKITPELLKAALETSISGDVESADIEICASGFDNLVLDEDLDELKSLQKALKFIGAIDCELVISELLQWLSSDSDKNPPELLDSGPEKANELWRAYDKASCAENPRKLAIEYESRQG